MQATTIRRADPMVGLPEQTRRNPGPGADLPPDLGRFVAALAYAVERGIVREMASHALLPLDVHLLVICREMGECTATQLTQLLPVDAARISRLVNGLVEQGLVIRRRPPNDRRVVMLRLSPDGEALTAEISRRMREFYAGLTRGLTEEEMRAFTNAALRIIANHEAMS